MKPATSEEDARAETPAPLRFGRGRRVHAHPFCTVTVTGTLKVAPWHPLSEDASMDTPPGMTTETGLFGGLVSEATGMLSPL